MSLNMESLILLQKLLFENQLLSVDEMNVRKNLILTLYRQWWSNKEARSDSAFYNRFFGEILPLCLLGESLKFSKIILIGQKEQKVVGVDAIVFDKNDAVLYLECTLAVDGEQRRLQLDCLEEYGHAPGFKKIFTNAETKASGKRKILFPENEMVPSVELEDRLRALLLQAINKKTKKDRASYQGAHLVVAFPKANFGIFLDEGLEEIIRQVIAESNNNIFSSIHMVDISTLDNNFIYSHYCERK